MTIATYLKRAKKRIERGWCQRAFAQDAAGDHVAIRSRAARAWCSAGAIASVCPPPYRHVCFAVFARAIRSRKKEVTTFAKVDGWNDAQRRTKQQVLDAFDRSIALAETEAV